VTFCSPRLNARAALLHGTDSLCATVVRPVSYELRVNHGLQCIPQPWPRSHTCSSHSELTQREPGAWLPNFPSI
jgi:hypothetical protein